MTWSPIPGETPLDDISGLKIKTITTRAALCRAEADNINEAATKYLYGMLTKRMAPFDLSWAKRLHREMFGRVWIWAGQIRTNELNLGVPAHQIQTQLVTLLDDLAFWQTSGMPLVEQAALLHHRSVAIHPFLNGNGRWSRMLANIWLRRNGSAVTAWPEETIGTESVIRNEYLAAIRTADQGDCQALVALHHRYTPSDIAPPGA